MKKKQIAIFGVKYFPSKGGTSRVVESLLWELKDHFDITIYCYNHEATDHHIPGIKTVQFPEIPVKGIGVFIYYFFCCIHLMLFGKYDLVHLHKMDAAFFLPVLGLKFKLAATSHALPYLNDKWSWAGKTYFKLAEYLFLNSGASLSTVSKAHLTHFKQRSKTPVRFIPNGVNRLKYVNPDLADSILKENEVLEDFLFFAARRLIPLKGCHTLIEALKEIDFQGTLVIAGDTEQMPVYTLKLIELAKGLDVRFIGYVSNMDVLNALISRSHYFVFPSELEAMSMMLLEVGMVGTPMICSDIPQNKAVLDDNEVLFFKSKNTNNLARQLSWAFKHPEEMRAKALNAKQKIQSTYLISAVTQKYRDWYDELLIKNNQESVKAKA